MSYVKQVSIKRLNAEVFKIQQKLSAKKILLMWRRKRIIIKISKMPQKLKEALRRFFL